MNAIEGIGLNVRPSGFVLEVVEGMGAVLDARVVPPVERDSGDAQGTWMTLAEGGWDSAAEDRDEVSRRDLIELGRIIGRYLPGVPLATSIVLRRNGAVAAEGVPLSLAIPRRHAAMPARVPYGGSPGVQIVGGNEPILESAKEDLAPTLPLASAAGSVDAVPLDVRYDLAILFAGECLGAAAHLLDAAVDYAKVREQFGRPIGAFQSLKHLLAEAQTHLEEATSAVIWASNDEAGMRRGLRLAASRCMSITETAGQVHGGIGMTWDMGLHFFVRHTMVARDLIEDLTA